jgi:hypothetical protein
MHATRVAKGFRAETRAASGRKHRWQCCTAAGSASSLMAHCSGWKKWQSGTVAAHMRLSGVSAGHSGTAASRA